MRISFASKSDVDKGENLKVGRLEGRNFERPLAKGLQI